ncbi:ABC transporter ATP-binding protein [Pontiellaceae bacterium B12219]|nr:ABC transporter ATP-binding protein [Pontiellaceae bacterium B12219]
MNADSKKTEKGFKRYKPYFSLLDPVKVQFGWGILAGVLYGAASGFGLPFLLYKVIPVLFEDPRPSIWIMAAYIAVFPIAMIFRAVFGFINTYLISFCGMRVLIQLQARVLGRLQELPLSFYHKNTIGDLMARVTGDTAALQQVLTRVANDLVKQPITMIGAISALVFLAVKEQDAWFLMLFAATVPVIILPLQIFGKRILKKAKLVQAKGGDVSRLVSENLNAVREIRAFNLQKREVKRFEAALDHFCALSMKVVKYNNIIRPTVEVIGVVCVSFAVIYMLQKNIEAAAASMLAALYMAYDPVKKFGELHMLLKRGEAALERIEDVLYADNTVPEPEHPVALGQIEGRVDFQAVSFRYLDDWVLKDVNLSFSPGTIVALVGPSGAGKTTIADLIPRFYDVQKGAVMVDGKDVKSIAKEELRNAVSVVSQDTFLFNESIMDNIRVGCPGASDEAVYEAARQAFAHDFILEMDDGYRTVVGERGARLSGGQKQRIAIARAFLKQSPILILDEATSALDSESEKKIQIALEELVKDKTVFMIAHRFATIKMADTIVVMKDGVVHGMGSHSALYESNDLYTTLYNRQFID